jgi:hypothetical protein
VTPVLPKDFQGTRRIWKKLRPVAKASSVWALQPQAKVKRFIL